MANFIGGIPPLPGLDNTIVGTADADVIFGDPFTTGAGRFFPGFPEVGGALTAGRGGDDLIQGLAGDDAAFGDAFEMAGTGQGGNDRLDGGGRPSFPEAAATGFLGRL